MFETVFDKLVDFIELFQCWTYVPEFDRGVVLRVGKFNRYLEPGFNWLIPLSIEQTIQANVKPEPVYLDVQSISTKDNYAANIQIGLIWRITEPRLFILENENTECIVTMVASGLVTEMVTAHKWSEVTDPAFLHHLRTRINYKVRKRGAKVDEVVMQDFANGAADRLWHEGISISAGDE